MSMVGTTSTAELLARLDARIKSAAVAAAPEEPFRNPSAGFGPEAPALWSYREAAAVLERFRPADLRPIDSRLSVDNPHALLLDDIQPASGGRRENLYELKPEIRRVALERLSTRAAMLAALNANPERWQGDSQELYEAWLRGTPPLPETQTYRELTISREIRRWLDGLVENLPSMESLDTCMARKDVTRSYAHLLTQGFVGRAKELQTLRDYVGVMPPDTLTGSVLRQLRAWLGQERRAPLVIHGPGGMGKSALVGKFLDEHASLPEEQRFPFAYLALDNPALRVAEPLTLIVESVAQLQRQFPGRESEFGSFQSAVKGYRDEQADTYWRRANAMATQSERLSRAEAADAALYRKFGELLHELARRRADDGEVFAPALLVIDTFEEAQHRDQEKLLGLWKMLGSVQDAHPILRIVISGRTPVRAVIGGQTAAELPLGELDLDSAVRLLVDQGVEDQAIARRIVAEVGGNPLTLRLAARALKVEPELGSPAGLKGIKTRRFGLFAVSQEVIRGQLYRRVLDHIHDPDVRRLAHPGMVLRRVTSALIAEVLADPCEIDLSEPDRAARLFALLGQEHAFVTLEPNGALKYRPEIRLPMLRLLEQSKPAQVRAIHEGAVGHYIDSDAVPDRAEELYHRLALDQEAAELSPRWLEGCGDYLADALTELPPRAVAWLASRAGFEVPREVFADADLKDWERNVGRKILPLLRHQVTGPALSLLGERSARSPVSPLYALETRVHWLIGDHKAALKVLDRGLESSPATANLGRVAELLWMKAQTLVQLGDRAGAAATLAEADRVTEGMPRGLCRFQVLTGLAQVLRGARGDQELPGLDEVRAQLARVLSELAREDLWVDPSLTGAALAVLGPDFPAAFRHGFEAIGFMLRVQELRLEERLVALLGKDMPSDVGQAALMALERYPADAKLLDGLARVVDGSYGQDYSLASANLVGIEDYREAWEIESMTEVLA